MLSSIYVSFSSSISAFLFPAKQYPALQEVYDGTDPVYYIIAVLQRNYFAKLSSDRSAVIRPVTISSTAEMPADSPMSSKMIYAPAAPLIMPHISPITSLQTFGHLVRIPDQPDSLFRPEQLPGSHGMEGRFLRSCHRSTNGVEYDVDQNDYKDDQKCRKDLGFFSTSDEAAVSTIEMKKDMTATVRIQILLLPFIAAFRDNLDLFFFLRPNACCFLQKIPPFLCNKNQTGGNMLS